MKRNSIKCSHCGGNDFVVNVNVVPRGINLICADCGHITDLAFFDDEKNVYEVNSPEEQALYNETYYRELTRKEVWAKYYPRKDEGGNK